jgi:hypothetical protein
METRPSRVGSSTKVMIGSTVITLLGVFLGAVIVIVGSLLKWKSDAVLGLYNVNGWSYENLTSGDGKLTFALGVVMVVALITALLLQNKAAYMIAAVASVVTMGLALYEWIFIASRPGITGPGHGLYMAFFGCIGCLLCALGGYLMMAESGAAPAEAGFAS